MTIREMLAILIDAPDLDASVNVRTHDGALLGGVCTIDTGYTQRTGDQYPPRIVLHNSAGDAARVTAEHVLKQADGDPITFEKLREAGVIS